MTVSFHKYGEYFPGTGELRDVGVGAGKNYAVNFPLRDGIDDKSYKDIFEPVIKSVMEYYRPQSIVLQCGGDSLSGDRLGCFNLSMQGHANCVNFVKSFNLPVLVLGGGGYTMRNVSRTWAYETGLLVGQKMGPDLPFNDYYEYYAPDYELEVRPSNMDNANSAEYLQKIKLQVIENLRQTTFAPSVQMTDVPRDPEGMNDEADAEMDDLDDDENPDARFTKRRWDKYVEKEGELSESEDEEENEANGVRKQVNGSNGKRRRNIMDYQNPLAVPDDNLGGGSGGVGGMRGADGVGSAAIAGNGSGAVSARSGRSQVSRRSEIGTDEEDVGREEQNGDEDVDMADGETTTVPAPPGTNGGSVRAQEATPPESPAQQEDDGAADDPATEVPAHVVAETGPDEAEAMDEDENLGEKIEEDAKEVGRVERMREDVTAEKATAVVERKEDEENEDGVERNSPQREYS